ncbi:phosphomannose isomerase type I family protein [Mycobacterium xenopi 4042]|uniref:Phosphomannose isomerase type I family protein n=1 Tax=Mycobacterium xenopi 4042 TaxID=1299334 RepID=X8DBS7_MYCXE|nr:phosphomannose isomerase type I family protein [Mycobacterium xenopi 4042]
MGIADRYRRIHRAAGAGCPPRGRTLARRASGRPAWLETDDGETSLLDALIADPEGQLGSAARTRFGDVLPFLVKVLAADEPLSLQAHPSAEQAIEGYLREERLGIPVSHRSATIATTGTSPNF